MKYMEMVERAYEIARECEKNGKSVHGWCRDIIIDYELREMEKKGESLSSK
jgi:hypothetical protein